MKDILASLAAIRYELERYGLWRRFKCLVEMTIFSISVFVVGVAVFIFAPPEFQAIAYLCGAISLGFGVLVMRIARIDYMLWQDARLAYEQSDEPPIRTYALIDEEVA